MFVMAAHSLEIRINLAPTKTVWEVFVVIARTLLVTFRMTQVVTQVVTMREMFVRTIIIIYGTSNRKHIAAIYIVPWRSQSHWKCITVS